MSSISSQMGRRGMLRRLVRAVRAIIGPLIGISFALIVFFTSLFGNYIVTLFLPMVGVFNQHRRFREIMDRAITFWMFIPLFFLHYVYRVNVRATGDRIDPGQPAIIIMNHRTRLDWFYFWLALYRINPWLMTTNKIALKQLLRYVPAAGFGMQASHYVFLKRDLETDVRRLAEAIDYYAGMQRPYQLLMFPEGTDKTDYTTRRSDEYAHKNGLVPLRNVLYPRTSGFVRLVQEMRRHNYLTCIYDVTVAYPADIVQNETDMIIHGRVSSTVHYDIRRVDAAELLANEASDEALHQWLIDTWKRKDEKLEQFYAETVRHKRRLDASGARNVWVRDNARQRFAKIASFWFWLVVVGIWLYHISFLLHVGLVFLALNYTYIFGVYGGIDHFVRLRWARWRDRTVAASGSASAPTAVV